MLSFHCLLPLFLLAIVPFPCVASSQNARFNCSDFRVPPEPANISFLHPGHVSVVMAFGDSITAGFAARATPLEARDISWSIGTGSAEALTFPFMLNQYRAADLNATLRLAGMSTKAVIPKDIFHLPKGDYHPETDHRSPQCC